MVTPYPDLRHFTTRDYGNRVGVFRILEALRAARVRATFPVNAVLLPRIRPAIEALLEDGHEIAAYGLDTNHIHWSGLEPGIERSWIEQTRTAFDKAGLKPRTWMSPARNQSFDTLDLIAEAYVLARADNRLRTVLFGRELDDRNQTEAEWMEQILAATEFTKREAPRFGGQMLGFSLTPYISGQPFRTWALRAALSALGHDAQVWSATATECSTNCAPADSTYKRRCATHGARCCASMSSPPPSAFPCCCWFITQPLRSA